MKVCSRSICIWTYFQRFKIQGFPSICEKGIEKKNQFLWKNERNECRQFDMVKFKRLMPRICNIYSRSNVIVQSASFGKTNNSFAVIIEAIEDAFFCCPFQFVLSDNVWLCAHSGICLHLNVLYFALFDLLELKL